jgi:hypothetical protein
MIRARSTGTSPVKAKVTLTDGNAVSVSAFITLTDKFSDIEVPLNSLVVDSALLMPRPYPGFLPLWFKAGGSAQAFKLQDAEKIEMTIGQDIPAAEFKKPYGFELQSIWLQK